ncbi:MAG: AI-2E family transporter [Chitinophagaceae bacterium]
MQTFNNRLRQILLMLLIVALAVLLVAELYVFLPGFLGAITLYILTQESYRELIKKRKWRKGLTALLFMLAMLLLIVVPAMVAVQILSPKINLVFHNSQEAVIGLKTLAARVKAMSGIEIFNEKSILALQEKIGNFIPSFLNSTATVLGNMAMMFFLYYYLLISGDALEKTIHRNIPLKEENIRALAHETKSMVRANAIGIPVISMVQGFFALIGYLIFGVNDYLLWGFMTGLFAFFPIVGTMVIWVPVTIYLYSLGQTWQAGGLLLYSLLVMGNMDTVARLTFMRKMGNIHPVITLLGVIAGLNLFGFWGFIFGPLLVSYLIILIKIYVNEFAEHTVRVKHAEA